MRTTTIFAETHTSERANHVAYRLVIIIIITVYVWFILYSATGYKVIHESLQSNVQQKGNMTADDKP